MWRFPSENETKFCFYQQTSLGVCDLKIVKLAILAIQHIKALVRGLEEDRGMILSRRGLAWP